MKNCPPYRRKKERKAKVAAFVRKYHNAHLDEITKRFLKDPTWLIKFGENEDISILTHTEKHAFGIDSNFPVHLSLNKNPSKPVPAVSFNEKTKNIASLLEGPQNVFVMPDQSFKVHFRQSFDKNVFSRRTSGNGSPNPASTTGHNSLTLLPGAPPLGMR